MKGKGGGGGEADEKKKKTVRDQALRELSASPRSSSILYDDATCDSLALNVVSDSCASVNCVVVVVRNTIGPFGRDEFPVYVFDGTVENETD